MFAQLRNRLVLVNIAIIAALFFILIVGTYFVTRYDTQRAAEDMMYGLASDLLADGPGAEMMGPLEPPAGGMVPAEEMMPFMTPPGTLFMKTDKNGNVVAHSPNSMLKQSDFARMVKIIAGLPTAQKEVSFQGVPYKYLVFPQTDGGGSLYVLHDFSRERSVQRALVTALSVVGLVCLLLSMAGSFYMANRAMVPVEEAWQQQKDFLADASHELRTPLSIIQTNLEVLRAEMNDTEGPQAGWLRNIEEMSERMNHLVQSLLFLARADARQEPENRAHFPLAEAIMAAVEPMKPAAQAKGVSLLVDSLKAAPFQGDMGQIEQVITILLDNAIRHTPEGGIISIGMERSSRTAVITIKDTGEGIAPEHLPRLFDRFYQVDPARADGGFGLGLAIARLIVENHHGMIEAASVVGEGTTFSIHLPLTW